MNKIRGHFFLYAVAAIAWVFGLATIVSGGRVLFGDEPARLAAGNYLPFVVWFNFLAGFAYVTAAVGLATRQPWAPRLALAIATTTALVFLVFGLFILVGTPFEARTAVAMTLRTAFWAGIAWFSHRRENVA